MSPKRPAGWSKQRRSAEFRVTPKHGVRVVYNARMRLAEGFCPHPLHGPLRRVDTLRHDAPVGGLGPERNYSVQDNPDSQMPGWCTQCESFWWYDPKSDTFATLMIGHGQAVLGKGWFRDADLAEVQIARIQVQVEAMGGRTGTLILLEPDGAPG